MHRQQLKPSLTRRWERIGWRIRTCWTVNASRLWLESVVYWEQLAGISIRVLACAGQATGNRLAHRSRRRWQLSPTSPLDCCLSNYLEQVGRISGWAPFLHWAWVGNGRRFIDSIVYDLGLAGTYRLEGWDTNSVINCAHNLSRKITHSSLDLVPYLLAGGASVNSIHGLIAVADILCVTI